MGDAPDPATSGPRDPVSARAGLNVAEALGGRRGVAETGIPSLIFLVVYTVTQDLTPSLWASLVSGGLLTLARLVRRDTIQHAASGLIGLAFCAFIAARTGKAEDFYLPGLFINVGYALAYLVSIVVRWPLLGVLVGFATGEGMSFRDNPARLRAFTQASWIWVAVFVLRLVVQVPFYLTKDVVALGTARLAMGYPLFALAGLLSWRIIRAAPAVERADQAEQAETPAETAD